MEATFQLIELLRALVALGLNSQFDKRLLLIPQIDELELQVLDTAHQLSLEDLQLGSLLLIALSQLEYLLSLHPKSLVQTLQILFMLFIRHILRCVEALSDRLVHGHLCLIDTGWTCCLRDGKVNGSNVGILLSGSHERTAMNGLW